MNFFIVYIAVGFSQRNLRRNRRSALAALIWRNGAKANVSRCNYNPLAKANGNNLNTKLNLINLDIALNYVVPCHLIITTMKKSFTIILITYLLSGTVSDLFSQSFVNGFVFEDLNNNSIKDRKEKGIPDVAVSNGSEVTLTDSKGGYSLPIAADNIVFVIKPGNYAVPVNEFNQPRFFYIHKPQGSPALKYAGTPPTGDLPKSVNFPLIPSDVKDNFRMLVFGDPQTYTLEEVDYFSRGIVSELKGFRDVDFGISLGDLVGDNLDLHPSYISAVKDVGIPWYNAMGNHDENYDVIADSLSDESFEKSFGPATYSFNHGMAHIIVLDDILYPDPRDSRGYWGGFRKDQLAFIENDLRFVPKDHLVILAFHIPIAEDPDNDSFRDEDRQKLFELLRDFPYSLTLSAHTHAQNQVFFSASEGWLQEKRHHHYNVAATCGSWYSGRPDANGIPVSTMDDGTPKGYAFINISKNQYTIDYKVAGKPVEYYFEIFAPKVVEQNKVTSAGIYANFFMGSASDTLYYRVDNSNWQLMTFIKDYDPSYLHLLHEWDYSEILLDGSRPPNPALCSHLWRGSIPTFLPVGEHTIEIKAKDMFGRELTQKSSYKIDVRK